MASPNAHEFAARFSQKAGLKADADKLGRLNGSGPTEGGLRKLWEMSELSASEFADEVALFFELPRVTLQEMMAAESRVQQFSRRFLREMAVFPCHPAGGPPTLVLADPTDRASIQAAAIVLGTAPVIKVASFEDIGTVLDQRLGEEEAASVDNAVTAT